MFSETAVIIMFVLAISSMTILFALIIAQNKKSKNDTRNTETIYKFSKEQLIEEIKKLNETYTEKEIITEEEKKSLIDELKKDIQINLLPKSILKEIKQEIDILNSKIENYGFSFNIEYSYDHVSSSIERQIRRLQMNSILNLYMGSLLTLGAFGFLFYSLVSNNNSSIVYDEKVSFNYISYILIIFLPKISLTIFIQIFALFFLKLYKTNIKDIKDYYREFIISKYKKAAVHSAITLKQNNSLQQILVDLPKMEHDFLIPKGYSTEEIEKEKLSIKENASFIDALKELLKNKPQP